MSWPGDNYNTSGGPHNFDSDIFFSSPDARGRRSRPATPPRVPRLTSPRLLRDAFSTHALPPPSNHGYQGTLRNVEHALHRADMALRDARAAFHQPTGHRNNTTSATTTTTRNFVDLTASSDDNNDDFYPGPGHFDRTRAVIVSQISRNNLYVLAPSDDPSERPQIPSIHALVTGLQMPPPPSRDTATPTADAAAVSRQRQARRNWERVERRNRERAERQTQADNQERARRDQSRGHSTHQFYHHEPLQRPRRASNASTSSSLSEISASSLASDSTQSGIDDNANKNPEPATLTTNAIDLTTAEDPHTLSSILAKEQQAAIAAQAPSTTDTSSGLKTYKCAICMDSPTNATTTICGHLFCHRCIVDSLKWSQQQRREDHHGGRPLQGLCPVCRKSLNEKEVSAPANRSWAGGLVSLEIKKMSRKEYRETQERKKTGADRDTFLARFDGDELQERKGKQRAKTEDDDDIVEIKDEDESKTVGLALTRGRRKRKRRDNSVTQGDSVDGDSLFGSP